MCLVEPLCKHECVPELITFAALPVSILQSIGTVEDFLRSCGGYQGNYSYTYQTREQFRNMFDHSLYDQVRSELESDKAFPEGYDKIARNNQWTAPAGAPAK